MKARLTCLLIAGLAISCSSRSELFVDGGGGTPFVLDGAPSAGDGASGSDGAALPPDSGTPRCLPACNANQICVDGSCKDLPSQCPCPVESYCDLGSNKCVAGCLSDDDCNAGRYCTDQRQCKDGCRLGQCGSNEVCHPATHVCQCQGGHHRCSGSCVAENVQSCGPSCQVCPSDPFGKTSCTAAGCQLGCDSGYRMCGGKCAACPTDKASSFTCSGSTCVATGCESDHHVCDGICELMGSDSCGPACNTCNDTAHGACSSGACYGVEDIGYYPGKTTCAARCAALGKTCGAVCDVRHASSTTPVINAGHYTQAGSWGYVACNDTPPGSWPTSIKCCCTEQLTGTPQPECTQHSDCGASEFCWAKNGICYPTTDSRCPPGYTYKGQCSDGKQFCAHSGLPSGTVFKFSDPCPTGTTHRGGFYCSAETKACVPD